MHTLYYSIPKELSHAARITNSRHYNLKRVRARWEEGNRLNHSAQTVGLELSENSHLHKLSLLRSSVGLWKKPLPPPHSIHSR